MSKGDWNGTSENSVHKGDYFIRNGIEISDWEAAAIIDAVANAATMKTAMSGRNPSFDEIKGYIKTAKFAASAAYRNVEYINSQVRDTGKKGKPSRNYSAPNQQARVNDQKPRDEFDDFDEFGGWVDRSTGEIKGRR